MVVGLNNNNFFLTNPSDQGEALYQAINICDAKGVEEFLKNNKNFDVTLPWGAAEDSPLQRAMALDAGDCLRCLLDLGYIGFSVDFSRMFYRAINQSNFDVAKVLVERDLIDLSLPCKTSKELLAFECLSPAISLFCKKEYQNAGEDHDMKSVYDFILCVIEKVPSVLNHKNRNDGRTIAHSVAFLGDFKFLQKLIDLGANIDIPDNYGSTPWQRFLIVQRGDAPLINYPNTLDGTSAGLFETLYKDMQGELLNYLDNQGKKALSQVSTYTKSMVTGDLYAPKQTKLPEISMQESVEQEPVKPTEPEASRYEVFSKALGEVVHSIRRIDMD